MQQVIKPHVAKYKKRLVEEFVKLMTEYPIVGVLNVENLPAPQFQKMRATLRDRVVIRMAKRRLIKIAIEQIKDKKEGIEQLEKHLVGMPALIFTKDNPFNLSKILKKSKSKAPARAGQTAPADIVVQAGPTPFAPGPIIGELNAVGLKTSVEGGKVAIAEQATVVKEGEKVSPEMAGMLSRLGITPMEIGLDLVAAYENEVVFTRDVLSIDEEEYLNNLKSAANDSFSLSIFIGYITEGNVEMLVKKAFNDAKALAVSKEIISDEVVKQMLSKAEQQVSVIKDAAKIEAEVKEEIKPEVKEEKPEVEEKVEVKEEVKPEIKVEEKPKEEVKIEEKKPEEKEKIKVEEKEKEEVKPEVKEIKKEEIKPKVEEKKEPEVKKEEIKPEIKEEKPKEEIKKPEVKEVPKEPRILKGVKAEGIEVKEKISEEDMKKAEEFVKQLKEKAAGIKREEPTAPPVKVEKEEAPKVEEQVSEMVKKAKEFGAGIRPPTAGDIVKEAEKEIPKPVKKEEPELPSLQELAEKAEKRKKKKKTEEVPSAHELAEKKKKEK